MKGYVCHTADKALGLILCRNEVAKRIQHGHLLTLGICKVFHGLKSMGMSAQNKVCTPVDNILRKLSLHVVRLVGILNACVH